jgi:hypothetical protein
VLGSFHGVQFGTTEEQKTEKKSQDNLGIIPFGDPEKYKELSKEEQEKLTAIMRGPLQAWAQDPMGKNRYNR